MAVNVLRPRTDEQRLANHSLRNCISVHYFFICETLLNTADRIRRNKSTLKKKGAQKKNKEETENYKYNNRINDRNI